MPAIEQELLEQWVVEREVKTTCWSVQQPWLVFGGDCRPFFGELRLGKNIQL